MLLAKFVKDGVGRTYLVGLALVCTGIVATRPWSLTPLAGQKPNRGRLPVLPANFESLNFPQDENPENPVS